MIVKTIEDYKQSSQSISQPKLLLKLKLYFKKQIINALAKSIHTRIGTLITNFPTKVWSHQIKEKNENVRLSVNKPEESFNWRVNKCVWNNLTFDGKTYVSLVVIAERRGAAYENRHEFNQFWRNIGLKMASAALTGHFTTKLIRMFFIYYINPI